MTRRRELPRELQSRGFRTLEASDHGVPRSRLRARDLNASVRGTRTLAQELTFRQRCLLYQRRMPGSAFFSHDTAALLLGIPLPPHRAAAIEVHIAVPNPHRAPHAFGIIGHKLIVRESELITLTDGLRVTRPSRTWADLGTRLQLADLVAAGDFVVHRRNPLATGAQLGGAVRSRRSKRGMPRLLAALELLDDRSESPPESVLRVLITLAGLPSPRVNHEVTDRFGEFVARTDLIIDEYRLVLEYMGDYHRTTTGQWRRDMTRRSRVEAQDWRVVELNADDLLDPDELVGRICAHAAVQRRHLGLAAT